MTDMVFVFPPAPRKYTFTHHLGAGYIRSYLHQHNIKTAQFTTSHAMTVNDIITGILEHNPRFVGFTCYDANYAYVRILARMLKKKNPGITIVLGGPTATFSSDVIMEHTPEIDVCVRGEGEQSTLELLQKEDTEGIPGITFRSGNTLISTGERPLISASVKGKELDILPSPYLTGVVPPDGETGLLTARGCVYHCTYCNFSIMFNHTIRYHSVDRVIQELILIHDHWDFSKKDNFMIHDDIFSLNLSRAKTICQRIIDEGIQLPFFVETRADNCDKELIQLMKEAGVQEVNFGLESASRTVLHAVKKAPDREKKFLDTIKHCVHWAKEAGITTSVSTIFGLPREGLKEAKETLDFVKELNVDEYYHNVLFLCAGTELFGDRQQYGLDAVHSPSFLPYMTVYAYNIEKVIPLPHARLQGQVRTWKKMYCDLLSYGSRDQNYKHLLIKKMPDSVEQLCRWLQEYCVVHLSVYDFTKKPREEVAVTRETLFNEGVPLGVYTVVDEESQCLSQYGQIDLSTPVPVVPFHRYREEGALYTLKQPHDVEVLAEFFAAHIREGILSFKPEEIPQTLVDACKWGESLCPALSRGVLVVDGNTVLSCYNGGDIGSVGDSVQKLKENVQDMLREKEKERGCDSCLVKNECSRCLFPCFDGKFCELKKRYPGISVLVTILEWLYRYAGDSRAVVQFRVDEDAPPLFYKGAVSKGDAHNACDAVRLVSLDGKAFAFTGDELQGFSLEPELAAILEAFQLNVDKEEVISYLCEKGADREDAVEAISRAEFVFEVAGLIKGVKS